MINENILNWSVALIILNPSSVYYSAYLKATMTFPHNYPYSPPSFKFNRPLTHPNVYPDGKLCISILHAPGEDEMSGESAGERWSPVQRVESVMLSIISLLDDAECSSPANVDAGVLLRKSPNLYRSRVHDDVEKSKQDIPEGFIMPTSMVDNTAASKALEKTQSLDDKEFWMDSDDDEEGFGGSDTDDEEMEDYDDDEDVDQEAVELQEDEEDQAEEEEEELKKKSKETEKA